MGYDFVAFANRTLKEYIEIFPYWSTRSIDSVVLNWYNSASVLYLISEPHRYQKINGEFSKKLSGSWNNSEYMWISDYDDIYDGNDKWKTEWKNITYESYVMLFEYRHPEIIKIISGLTKKPRSILILGKIVEETKSKELENEIIECFGKSWRNWYYYALANRFNESALKNWPAMPKS